MKSFMIFFPLFSYFLIFRPHDHIANFKMSSDLKNRMLVFSRLLYCKNSSRRLMEIKNLFPREKF